VPGFSELHQLLATVTSGIADAQAHLERAKSLLEECHTAIVDAQAQAQPWVPAQLVQAIDLSDEQSVRLGAADELLNGYRARL
jgi:hypothetical protein